MKIRWVLLVSILLTSTLEAQVILRPPSIDTCSDCPPLDSYWCQLLPDPCIECFEECGEQPGEPPRQMLPTGPPYDSWLGDYRLPRGIGVIQLAHELTPPDITSHFTNLDLAKEVSSYGFNILKVWVDNHPFDGDTQPFCYDLYDTGNGDWWCEYDGIEWDHVNGRYLLGESHPQFEDMIKFWSEAPVDVIFVRFHRYGYYEGACMAKTFPPYYAITKRLYELIGWRDITIIFSDWEEDWWPWGCDGPGEYQWPFHFWWSQERLDQCLEENTEDECGAMVVEQRYQYLEKEIEKRQTEVEKARKEAFLALGYRPKLRVMTSAVLNRYPANQREHEILSGVKMLAERIPLLKKRPDLLGLSYWSTGNDPIETLEWVKNTTSYPPRRIYIDELGAVDGKQVQRFTDYVPAFFDWGIKIINIWMWRQTWCDGNTNRGLWKQQQPCQGKVIWTTPTDGLDVLIDLNRRYQ